VKIRVEFGEFRVENEVRKGPLRRNRRKSVISLTENKNKKPGLFCSEIGFSVFIKVVDMSVSFNWALI